MPGLCLVTLASISAAQSVEGPEPAVVCSDITRITSEVVVGIDSLGGGAILRYCTSVHRLITAASLWLTASVGLAAGLGFFFGGVVTVGLALLVLSGLRPLEKWTDL